MSYRVRTIPNFDKALKRLAKKYPSLKVEFIALLDSLEKEPEQGTPIGNHCFKIRLSIASKGKGKSGGARVIIHVVVTDKIVFLLDIYDKSEQANISEKELAELLKMIADK
jgi:mRNA-degrading endonuclease RelE of RelBE toxin-antitoxin system